MAILDTGTVIWLNLVKVYYALPHTKSKASEPSVLKKKIFFKYLICIALAPGPSLILVPLFEQTW